MRRKLESFLETEHVRQGELTVQEILKELGQAVDEIEGHNDLSDFEIESYEDRLDVEGGAYRVRYYPGTKKNETLAYPEQADPSSTEIRPQDYRDRALRRHVERGFGSYNTGN